MRARRAPLLLGLFPELELPILANPLGAGDQLFYGGEVICVIVSNRFDQVTRVQSR